jgi:site-specific recombinase XerD
MPKVVPKALLEAPQVVAIIDAAESENIMHAALIGPVLFERGARAGEPGLMTLDHVDLRLGLLRMPRLKGGLDESWPMSERARDLMARYLATRHGEPESIARVLFPGRARLCGVCHGRGRLVRGRGSTREVRTCNACAGAKRTHGMGRQMVYRVVRHYCERLGLPHRHPHVLRHSIVTHLLNAGVDPEAVRRIVGHVRLATTYDYKGLTHASRTEAERALRSVYGQRGSQ